MDSVELEPANRVRGAAVWLKAWAASLRGVVPSLESAGGCRCASLLLPHCCHGMSRFCRSVAAHPAAHPAASAPNQPTMGIQVSVSALHAPFHRG